MRRKKFHITSTMSGGWKIKEEGGSRAIKLFDTKEKAIRIGRKITKLQQPSQLIIHKKNGIIQTEYTYKNDPSSSKG